MQLCVTCSDPIEISAVRRNNRILRHLVHHLREQISELKLDVQKHEEATKILLRSSIEASPHQG